MLRPACPSCGERNDGSTFVGDADHEPEPGDISVCFYCARVARFAGVPGLLVFEPMSPQEIAKLDPALRSQVERTVHAIRQFAMTPPSLRSGR